MRSRLSVCNEDARHVAIRCWRSGMGVLIFTSHNYQKTSQLYRSRLIKLLRYSQLSSSEDALNEFIEHEVCSRESDECPWSKRTISPSFHHNNLRGTQAHLAPKNSLISAINLLPRTCFNFNAESASLQLLRRPIQRYRRKI